VRNYFGRESTGRKEALGRKSRQNNQLGILGGREGRPRRARPLGGKRTKTPSRNSQEKKAKVGRSKWRKPDRERYRNQGSPSGDDLGNDVKLHSPERDSVSAENLTGLMCFYGDLILRAPLV